MVLFACAAARFSIGSFSINPVSPLSRYAWKKRYVALFISHLDSCSKNFSKTTLQTNFNDFRSEFGQLPSNKKRSVGRATAQARKQVEKYIHMGEPFSSTCNDNCMLCMCRRLKMEYSSEYNQSCV